VQLPRGISILVGRKGWTDDRIARCGRAVERVPIDVEKDSALFGKDVRDGRDRQHTPTPEEDTVTTDRDSFTVWPGEFDERPYSSPVPSQDGISPCSRKPFSKLPRIAPALRRTHDGILPVHNASSGPRAKKGRAGRRAERQGASAVPGPRVIVAASDGFR